MGHSVQNLMQLNRRYKHQRIILLSIFKNSWKNSLVVLCIITYTRLFTNIHRIVGIRVTLGRGILNDVI